jgi:hypothetical protein
MTCRKDFVFRKYNIHTQCKYFLRVSRKSSRVGPTRRGSCMWRLAPKIPIGVPDRGGSVGSPDQTSAPHHRSFFLHSASTQSLYSHSFLYIISCCNIVVTL